MFPRLAYTYSAIKFRGVRGGALFIDYGEAHALEDSLRCFKGHEEVQYQQRCFLYTSSRLIVHCVMCSRPHARTVPRQFQFVSSDSRRASRGRGGGGLGGNPVF